MENRPENFQQIMQFSLPAHLASFAQAVLYRGAGFDIVWGEVIAALGLLFFRVALMGFRRMFIQIQA